MLVWDTPQVERHDRRGPGVIPSVAAVCVVAGLALVLTVLGGGTFELVYLPFALFVSAVGADIVGSLAAARRRRDSGSRGRYSSGIALPVMTAPWVVLAATQSHGAGPLRTGWTALVLCASVLAVELMVHVALLRVQPDGRRLGAEQDPELT